VQVDNDIVDARLELDEADTPASDTTEAAPRTRTRELMVWSVSAAVCGALVAGLGGLESEPFIFSI
jgi:hypothetical protein